MKKLFFFLFILAVQHAFAGGPSECLLIQLSNDTHEKIFVDTKVNMTYRDRNKDEHLEIRSFEYAYIQINYPFYEIEIEKLISTAFDKFEIKDSSNATIFAWNEIDLNALKYDSEYHYYWFQITITTHEATVNAREGLWMRNEPDLNGTKIFVLPYGAVVKITMRNRRSKIVIDGLTGRWTCVKLNDTEGWVFDGYLKYILTIDYY
jgi:hypothetical protein